MDTWTETAVGETLNGARISDGRSLNHYTLSSYHLWPIIWGGVPEACRTSLWKGGPQPALPYPRELPGEPGGLGQAPGRVPARLADRAGGARFRLGLALPAHSL